MNDEPRWRRYLRLRGPDLDADINDELRFHLEMRERDHLADREFALGQYFKHCLADCSGRANYGNIVSLCHQGFRSSSLAFPRVSRISIRVIVGSTRA